MRCKTDDKAMFCLFSFLKLTALKTVRDIFPYECLSPCIPFSLHVLIINSSTQREGSEFLHKNFKNLKLRLNQLLLLFRKCKKRLNIFAIPN